MIGSMAPKPKVSKETMINFWYQMKRQREQNGNKSEKGLNSAVATKYGLTGQYVGRVMKAYREEIADEVIEPNEPIIEPIEPNNGFEPKPNLSNQSKSETGPAGPPRIEIGTSSVQEAREKWDDAVSHLDEGAVPEENEPSGVGGSWLSRLNDAAVIKQLKKENGKLELRLKKLEGQVVVLQTSRPGLQGSPRASPRRDQILEVLADGKTRTYNEIQVAMGWGGNIRAAMISLEKEGKVVRKETTERKKTKRMDIPRYRFKLAKQVQDLM